MGLSAGIGGAETPAGSVQRHTGSDAFDRIPAESNISRDPVDSHTSNLCWTDTGIMACTCVTRSRCSRPLAIETGPSKARVFLRTRPKWRRRASRRPALRQIRSQQQPTLMHPTSDPTPLPCACLRSPSLCLYKYNEIAARTMSAAALQGFGGMPAIAPETRKPR